MIDKQVEQHFMQIEKQPQDVDYTTTVSVNEHFIASYNNDQLVISSTLKEHQIIELILKLSETYNINLQQLNAIDYYVKTTSIIKK